MFPRHAVAFCLASLAALPCSAQDARSTIPLDAAFESFLRVTATLGQPVAVLQRIWPASLTSTTPSSELALSAAQRIRVTLSDASPRDTIRRRVAEVQFTDVAADTVALRAHVQRMQRRLQALIGGPNLCATPLGEPAHLHAAQSVARVWSRGLGGQETELHWAVTPGGPYLITVTAGGIASRGIANLACDARMP